MTGSSDAWMDNFETPTFESENEPETKEEPNKIENIIPQVTENKTNISLPMTETSETWMDEFEAPAFDSDDEVEETEKLGENARATEVSTTEITKETKSDANISLPMTGASEVWMDDFEASFDSDVESEKDQEIIDKAEKNGDIIIKEVEIMEKMVENK